MPGVGGAGGGGCLSVSGGSAGEASARQGWLRLVFGMKLVQLAAQWFGAGRWVPDIDPGVRMGEPGWRGQGNEGKGDKLWPDVLAKHSHSGCWAHAPPRTRGRRVGQEAGRNLCCWGDPVLPSSAPAVRPHRSKPMCDAAPAAAATLTTPSLTFPTHPQEDKQ